MSPEVFETRTRCRTIADEELHASVLRSASSVPAFASAVPLLLILPLAFLRQRDLSGTSVRFRVVGAVCAPAENAGASRALQRDDPATTMRMHTDLLRIDELPRYEQPIDHGLLWRW